MDLFEPLRMNSAPWCVNGHLHTISCSLLTRPAFTWQTRHTISTPDGDFLHVDTVDGKPNTPLVLLLHGLEGNSNRYYIKQLAGRLMTDGFRVAALNFRSCSGELNRQPRFYHSGDYPDLVTAIEWCRSFFGVDSLFCAGFSLGASVLLNMLAKDPAEEYIRAFCAISAPYDLKQGSINLQRGFNKLYEVRFLQTLRTKLKQKRERFEDLPRFTGNTLYSFDDQVTGPVHGFPDAEAYYRECSSAFLIEKVRRPGLLIHSREDPLCPFEYTPTKQIFENRNLTALFPKRGGHVGFWSLPPGWLDDTVSRYFAAH